MREILFRGKRTYNDKWVEGSLVIEGNTAYIIGKNEAAHPVVLVNMCSVNIKPKTIGQYTGLTDKNGVKIFEGDIVKYCPIFEEERGDVKWSSTTARFLIELSDGAADSICQRTAQICEVIGNIHDNPELLNQNTKEEK